MKTKPIKSEYHFAYLRLFMGSIVGFLIFFSISALVLYVKGWYDADVATNPYLGPPPLMTAMVFGFFGFVFGALLSLITKKWEQYKS